jgi:hypothetical protein
MKIALCLYGITGNANKGGSGEKIPLNVACNGYLDNAFFGHKVDVFIHSWSTEDQQIMHNLYKPKLMKVEPQKEFPDSVEKGIQMWKKVTIVSNIKRLVKNGSWISKKYCIKYAFRMYSRWYSLKKSVGLKKKHEQKHGFKYDYVMIGRFDIFFYSPFDFNNMNPELFYAPNRNHGKIKAHSYKPDRINHGIGNSFYDAWFVSGTNNIDIFAKLYDDIDKYPISSHYSSWEHVKKNIGESNVEYLKYRYFDYEFIRVLQKNT